MPVITRLRELVGECADERVALLAVAGAHAAQVAVELAARDEVGERVLLDAGGAAVGDELRVRHGLQQRGGKTSQPRRSAGASVLLVVPA